MSTLRPQIPIMTGADENQLKAIQQTGVEYVSLGFKRDQIDYDLVMKEKERLSRFNLQVSDAFCNELQKNKSIHLGRADRDSEIDAFNNMLRIFGKAEIPFTSIAWQPNGILRTARDVGKYTRGGVSFLCDEAEIMARPNAEERSFEDEEIWNNFAYFMERVIPVAEEYKIKMALHPNDPPLACMAGIPSLIYNTECYRRAFKIANSPMLGMKLCVGCWLEGGEAFGDLLSDIKEFTADGRILCVHFRNTSSTLPSFEETLIEDGYADMYEIMRTLVASKCDAVISIDHGFAPIEGFGGMTGSFIYLTGYMKGMLHVAERELGLR